jgi:thiol-disulfide isomerase/thioredoxin
MKWLMGLLLLPTVCASADTLHLISGKPVKATVTSYDNSAFEAVDEDKVSKRYQTTEVKRIEFASGGVAAILSTTNSSNVKGRVTSYENGAFTVFTDKQQTLKIPVRFVVRVKFTNPVTEIEKILLIPRGENFELPKLLVFGKVTVVVFFISGEAGCSQLMPFLEQLANRNKDIFLRKIDIGNFQSDVAKQLKLRVVPHTEIYNADGNHVGTVDGPGPQMIGDMIEKTTGVKP